MLLSELIANDYEPVSLRGKLVAKYCKLYPIFLVMLTLSLAPLIGAEEGAAPITTGAAETPKPTFTKAGHVNIIEMEIQELITNVARITGKNFIWDDKVKGKTTIISEGGMPADELWRVFEAVMKFHGFQLVPIPGVKELYKIVRITDLSGETIPTYIEGLISSETESYITRLIKLKYIDPQSASAVLNNLKTKDAKIIPYPPTNTLIVIESANNLNRLMQILSQMDVPMKLPQVKIVRMKYAPADKLAAELTQIFSAEFLGALSGGGDDGGFDASIPTPEGAPQQPRRPRRPPQPGAEQQQDFSGSGQNKSFKIIPDARTNSLIVIATEDIIGEVLRLINELDIPIEGEEGIYVYYCQNATATDLAGTLSSLAGGAKTTSVAAARTAPGSTESGGGARQQQGQAPSTSYYAASTTSQGGTLDFGTLSGEVRISADEATNSLIIVASKRDYGILLDVIKKLDIRRKQVFVEAVILEVEMSDDDSVGTSFAGAAAIDSQTAMFGSTALGGLNSMGILPAIAAGATTGSGLPGGFSVGALTNVVKIKIPGVEDAVKIPAFSALFNALVARNNVNVLSTPNLLTTDNEEAEINVGQNIPIPTGQTVGTGGTTTMTIQRETVGIKLKVTPQVSEGNTVRLIISTEISGVAPTAVAGIDVNTLGITTTVKSAQTTVVVDNHQTVVIGGLIENRDSESTYQVPFLGDIPVLGWLFKQRTRKSSKTNLVILLTPHIVRGADDLDEITDRYNRRRIKFLDEATGGTYKDPFFMEPLILPEEDAATAERPIPNAIEVPLDRKKTEPEKPDKDWLTISPGKGSGKPMPEPTTPEGEGKTAP